MSLSGISYSKFKVHHFNHDDMDRAELIPLPFNPGVEIKGYSTEINEPCAQVVVEDFLPNTEIWWTFPHDEFHYCVSGSAEIEFFLPPLYAESVKETIRPGSVVLMPSGGRMNIKTGDEPYRHICFCFPGPDYPFPPLRDK